MEQRDVSQEMLTISRSQLEWLQAVARAARRFDEAGSVVHQMNPRQWQAYDELKALFHSGIEGQAYNVRNLQRKRE